MHKNASPNEIHRDLYERVSARHGNSISMDDRHIASAKPKTSESTRQLILSQQVGQPADGDRTSVTAM